MSSTIYDTSITTHLVVWYHQECCETQSTPEVRTTIKKRNLHNSAQEDGVVEHKMNTVSQPTKNTSCQQWIISQSYSMRDRALNLFDVSCRETSSHEQYDNVDIYLCMMNYKALVNKSNVPCMC